MRTKILDLLFSVSFGLFGGFWTFAWIFTCGFEWHLVSLVLKSFAFLCVAFAGGFPFESVCFCRWAYFGDYSTRDKIFDL